MIDVNVYLAQWPFRRLAADQTDVLAAQLHRSGITEAWCGSFEALLERDIAGVNSRLADACRSVQQPQLVPFGCVHPLLPDWREDLCRCHEDHRMPGIRVHPNYHGYAVDHPEFIELLKLAAERELIVQLVVSMDDERTQHPLVQVPHTDLRALPAIIRQTTGLKLVVLNGFRGLRVGMDLLAQLAAAGEVTFDIAMLEGIEGVAKATDHIGATKMLFGSYSPRFVFESAALKLKESALPRGIEQAVTLNNARRLLPRPT